MEYQECASLEVKEEFANSVDNGVDTLSSLMNLQKDIQETVYGYDFEKMRTGKLVDLKSFVDMNYAAIQDELREMYNALGGVKDGIGSAVWKPWKKEHQKIYEMSFDDLSESDKLELKYELIDIQHFLFNICLSVGMTSEEFYNLYFAKNRENIERQKRGY